MSRNLAYSYDNTTAEQINNRYEESIIAVPQRTDANRLADIKLTELGYDGEIALAKAKAVDAGVPFIFLEDGTIDPRALTTLPVEVWKKYQVLPIAFSQDKLMVAMQKPRDIMAIDDLRIIAGCAILPVVVPRSQFVAALEKHSRNQLALKQQVVAQPLLEQRPDYVYENNEHYADTEKPAVQLAQGLLTLAVVDKASDIHIEPYEDFVRVRFRIDGVMHDVLRLPKPAHPSLVSRYKIMADMDIAERRLPQDGRFSITVHHETVDIRIASLPVNYGERLTMRLLYRAQKIISLGQLGISRAILAKYRAVLNTSGCVLAVGPTGSGKSSTIYSSLAVVDSSSKNVITLEDPIEYRMENINQIQINQKAGLTFARGLRNILRNDPDIIMVGEIRDFETAKSALEAAMTGHLVFSTLHTNDAAGAISRLMEMGMEPFVVVSSITCVLAQRLVRRLCPYCKIADKLCKDDLKHTPEFPWMPGETAITLYKPKGCMRCSNTGYRGRMGIFELLFVSPAIVRLALERRSAGEIKKVAVEQGMVTLRQDGLLKVRQGITSLEEVLRVL